MRRLGFARRGHYSPLHKGRGGGFEVLKSLAGGQVPLGSLMGIWKFLSPYDPGGRVGNLHFGVKLQTLEKTSRKKRKWQKAKKTKQKMSLYYTETAKSVDNSVIIYHFERLLYCEA